jgi:WD40 repeat protein
MWDTAHLAGEPETLTGPSTDADSVVALAFAPSGNRLATGHRYGLARVWDLAPASGPKLLGKPLNAGTRAALQALAFSANGRSLTTYHYDDNVRVWEPGSDSGPRLLGKVATSQTATGAKPALFSDDATTLVTGDRHGTIQLWRIEDWFPSAFPPYSPPRPEETPVVSGFSARQVRATVGGDGRLQLWRVTSKSAPRKAATLPTGLRAAPTALAFSGDGRLLVVGDADGALAWWDVTDPAHPDRAGTGQCPSGMTALWVSAMEVRAVNKAGRLCRVSAAGKTRTRQLPGGTVTTAQLSLDGSLLAMGHDEGTVGLWNLKDPAHPRLLDTDLRMPVEGAQVLSLSSNHRMLAAAGQDGTIRLWAADGTDWTVVDVLSGPTSAVTSLIFASDGRYLAAGTNNGHVHLWNLSDGQRPRALGPPLTGRTASVTSGVFLSTTPMLLTTDEFGLVRGWSLGTLAALTRDSLREACLRVGHGLNETQWRRYASGAPYRQSCP